jgi:hypothetical protein
MSYFLKFRASFDTSYPWTVVDNRVFNCNDAARKAISERHPNIYYEYAIGDCDHYPDKALWLAYGPF